MKIRQPDIKMVTREDLASLDPAFPSEFNRTHADDLADQALGDKSFLVAWINAEAVGHVLVNWQGARQPEPAAAFPGCPEIFRLAVREPYTRRGIATVLLGACESEARQRGHARVGLGTDPHVPEEHNLYLRLGYLDAGIGLFDDVYRIARGGKVRVLREPTRFLIKLLD